MPNILGCVVSHWIAIDLRVATLLKETVSTLSQTLAIMNRSLSRQGIVCPTLLSVLGFDLAWVCTGFVHAVTTILRSDV